MLFKTPEDFLAAPRHAVTVFGMSGVGKTRLAALLRKSHWFHYSVDYRIGTRHMGEFITDNFKLEAMKQPFLRDLLRSDSIKISSAITFSNLDPLSTYLGRPGNKAKCGLPLDEYEKMAMDANAVGLISLNKKWYETDSYKDVREIDILEDKKGEDPTRRLQRKDLMRMVTKGLNRNERLIIILYYYEELTMKEIGATLDLSESRVSQMHSSIIQRLQSQLSARRPEFGT